MPYSSSTKESFKGKNVLEKKLLAKGLICLVHQLYIPEHERHFCQILDKFSIKLSVDWVDRFAMHQQKMSS